MYNNDVSDSISDPDLRRFRALVLWPSWFNWDKEKYIKTAFPNDPIIQKEYLENTDEYREKLEFEMKKNSDWVELCDIINLINVKVIELVNWINSVIK
jgi:hypothetical protein